MTEGHQMQIVEHGSFTSAICSCGWRGPARRSRRLARHDGDEHLGEVSAG